MITTWKKIEGEDKAKENIDYMSSLLSWTLEDKESDNYKEKAIRIFSFGMNDVKSFLNTLSKEELSNMWLYHLLKSSDDIMDQLKNQKTK